MNKDKVEASMSYCEPISDGAKLTVIGRRDSEGVIHAEKIEVIHRMAKWRWAAFMLAAGIFLSALWVIFLSWYESIPADIDLIAYGILLPAAILLAFVLRNFLALMTILLGLVALQAVSFLLSLPKVVFAFAMFLATIALGWLWRKRYWTNVDDWKLAMTVLIGQ